MKVNKKVTDFITLEEGNIGRKAAVVTGALLASSVLGLALTTEVAKAAPWCNYPEVHTDYGTGHYEIPHSDVPHTDSYPHNDHCDLPY